MNEPPDRVVLRRLDFLIVLQVVDLLLHDGLFGDHFMNFILSVIFDLVIFVSKLLMDLQKLFQPIIKPFHTFQIMFYLIFNRFVGFWFLQN